jgi:hypothetical protein
MIDELLRDREKLYETAREGRALGALCSRLLLVFIVTAGLYGAVMGSFRWIHPEYFFSDFELSAPGLEPVQGEVAGMNPGDLRIYSEKPLPPEVVEAEPRTVRFNLSRPSDPYPVASVDEEKGYARITLAAGARLVEPRPWRLPLIVALKVPALFLLTLAVCAFALYVLNLAFGLRLHFMPVLTLILFALAGTGVMLGVFAPIALMFSIVTASYHFMIVLHVVIFAIAGLFGVRILGQGLTRLRPRAEGDVAEAAVSWFRTRVVLLSWLVLYSLVGAQAAWTLKPFLGTPYLPATPPFRIERGNIFVSTLGAGRHIGSR